MQHIVGYCNAEATHRDTILSRDLDSRASPTFCAGEVHDDSHVIHVGEFKADEHFKEAANAQHHEGSLAVLCNDKAATACCVKTETYLIS